MRKPDRAQELSNAWSERIVVIDRAASSVDLLFHSPYTKESERLSSSQYEKLIIKAVEKLKCGWRERAHYIDETASKSTTCFKCLRLGVVEVECPTCSSEPHTYSRVIFVAIQYVHRVLLTGAINDDNIDDYCTACLILALKAQMPATIQWGMTRVIQLVTGSQNISSQQLLSIRENIINCELVVFQVLGPGNTDCILAVDLISSQVELLFGKDPLQVISPTQTSIFIRKRGIVKRAVQFFTLIVSTPLPVICTPEEISACLVWLAWRTSCSTTAEVLLQENQLLQKLKLTPETENNGNGKPGEEFLHILIRKGLLRHSEKLWYNNRQTPQAVLTFEAEEGPLLTECDSGKTHSLLTTLTASIDSENPTVDDREIYSRWRVQRHTSLWALSTLLKGDPLYKRRQSLKASRLCPTPPPCKAILETVYWLGYRCAQVNYWEPLRSLRLEATSEVGTATNIIQTALEMLVDHDVIKSNHSFALQLRSRQIPQQFIVDSKPYDCWSLFEQPSPFSKEICEIPDGSEVISLSQRGETWFKIKYKNYLGWVLRFPSQRSSSPGPIPLGLASTRNSSFKRSKLDDGRPHFRGENRDNLTHKERDEWREKLVKEWELGDTINDNQDDTHNDDRNHYNNRNRREGDNWTNNKWKDDDRRGNRGDDWRGDREGDNWKDGDCGDWRDTRRDDRGSEWRDNRNWKDGGRDDWRGDKWKEGDGWKDNARDDWKDDRNGKWRDDRNWKDEGRDDRDGKWRDDRNWKDGGRDDWRGDKWKEGDGWKDNARDDWKDDRNWKEGDREWRGGDSKRDDHRDNWNDDKRRNDDSWKDNRNWKDSDREWKDDRRDDRDGNWKDGGRDNWKDDRDGKWRDDRSWKDGGRDDWRGDKWKEGDGWKDNARDDWKDDRNWKEGDREWRGRDSKRDHRDNWNDDKRRNDDSWKDDRNWKEGNRNWKDSDREWKDDRRDDRDGNWKDNRDWKDDRNTTNTNNDNNNNSNTNTNTWKDRNWNDKQRDSNCGNNQNGNTTSTADHSMKGNGTDKEQGDVITTDDKCSKNVNGTTENGNGDSEANIPTEQVTSKDTTVQ